MWDTGAYKHGSWLSWRSRPQLPEDWEAKYDYRVVTITEPVYKEMKQAKQNLESKNGGKGQIM